MGGSGRVDDLDELGGDTLYRDHRWAKPVGVALDGGKGLVAHPKVELTGKANAARIMRRGSSAKVLSGSKGVRMMPFWMSAMPPKGSLRRPL